MKFLVLKFWLFFHNFQLLVLMIHKIALSKYTMLRSRILRISEDFRLHQTHLPPHESVELSNLGRAEGRWRLDMLGLGWKNAAVQLTSPWAGLELVLDAFQDLSDDVTCPDG